MPNDLADVFQEYWRKTGRLSVRDNPDRTLKNILKKLEACNSIADIDEYVIGLKSARETVRRMMVAFL